MRQSPKYDRTKHPKNVGNHHKELPLQKNNDRKREKLENMQLENEFDTSVVISRDYVRELIHNQYANPVISLYLSFDGNKNIREPKNYITLFHSLKNTELKNRERFVSSLSHGQEKSLREDLDKITELLEQHLDVEGFRSLVIFKSGKELSVSVELPFTFDEDMLVIDSNPYTSPLEVLLQEQKKVMIVKMDKNETSFHIYEMGKLTKVHSIDCDEIDKDLNRERPEKIQQHHNEDQSRHFKDCADYLYKQSSAHAFDYVIVVGHENITTKKFIHTLHPEVANKLIEETTISPLDLDRNTLPTLISSALENYECQREDEDKNELAQAKGQHVIIEGIEQVLSAHNRGLLRELYIQGNYQVSGFICPGRHYINLEDGAPCPICGTELTQAKNCVDELIETAVTSNMPVHIFTRQPEIMEEFSKIAAVTYSPST